MKLEFSWQIFEQSSDITFHGNVYIGSRIVSYGRTDKHDEANGCFSQFSAPGLITLTVNNAFEEATKITTTVLLEILFIKLKIHIVQSGRTYI
jgi:hypothetical protein